MVLCGLSAVTKRRLLYANVGAFGVLSAIEYSIILPTIWIYLSTLYDSSSWYFGICISGFHMSALIFSPVFGFLSDRKFRSKPLVLVANCFQIAGSVLYLIRVEHLVFVSRFVAGIGAAVGSVLFADVNRVTGEEKRTSILAFLMLCRQIGLFAGPALNFFLSHFNFNLGPLRVDLYTAPGFTMASLWILFQIVMALTYFDAEDIDFHAPNPAETPASVIASTPAPPPVGPALPPAPSETSPLLQDSEAHDFYGSAGSLDEVIGPVYGESQASARHDGDKTPSSVYSSRFEMFRRYVDEFSEEGVVVLLGAFLVSSFGQMALETMVTPVMGDLFHFGEFENTLFFAVAGGIIFAVCILVGCLSRRVHDRTMSLIGLLFMLVSLVWGIVVLPVARFGQPFLLVHFVGLCVFDVVGLTIVSIACFSLYSKLVKRETQGLAMGFRRAANSLGLILGPLWAGSLIHDLYLMLGVILGLLSLIVAMYILSFKKLTPTPVSNHHRSSRA